MKKLSICAIISLICTLLFSADIKMPDEVIVGTVNLPADSVTIHKDLSSLQEIQKLDFLFYNPELQPDSKDYRLNTINKELYVSLFVGNHWKTDLKVNYRNKNNKFLNANAEYHYLQLSPNWSIATQNLNWDSPELKYYKLKPEVSFNHILFFNKYQNAKAYAFSLTTPLDISNYVKYINSLNLKTNIIGADQCFKINTNNQAKVSMNDLDLLASTSLTLPFKVSSHDLNFGMLKGHFLYEYKVNTNDYIPWFDNTAFVLNYSRNILPSLYFSKSFKPDDNILINWINDPYISKESHYTSYVKNPSANINNTQYQIQSPLNMKLSMNYFTILPVYAAYQLSWNKNQEIYDYHNSFNFYDVNIENTFINRINLNTCYSYNKIDFDYTMEIIKSSPDRKKLDQIPYLAHFTNTFAVLYSKWNVNNRTELITLMNRKDSFNNELKDVLLLNSYFTYPWKYNLNFNLRLDNLLNAHYHRYTLTPKEGIQMQLGASYLF